MLMGVCTVYLHINLILIFNHTVFIGKFSVMVNWITCIYLISTLLKEGILDIFTFKFTKKKEKKRMANHLTSIAVGYTSILVRWFLTLVREKSNSHYLLPPNKSIIYIHQIQHFQPKIHQKLYLNICLIIFSSLIFYSFNYCLMLPFLILYFSVKFCVKPALGQVHMCL